MSAIISNNRFTRCRTAIMIGGRGCGDIDISKNIISECGDGIVFENNDGSGARIKGNKITNCNRGVIVGESSRMTEKNAANGYFTLSPAAIAVRHYLSLIAN